jgi:uncharacterized cupin superfamily protein
VVLRSLPMRIFNLFGDQEWDGENDRGGYRHRVAAIGNRLGASMLGGSLYELPPGEKTWPYHYELAEEEWLLVVRGVPTLREPGGERTLREGGVVCFPAGPGGAHQLRNETDEPVRVALFSTVGSSPTGTVYPDSQKVQMRGPGVRFRLRIDTELDYWDGEA